MKWTLENWQSDKSKIATIVLWWACDVTMLLLNNCSLHSCCRITFYICINDVTLFCFFWNDLDLGVKIYCIPKSHFQLRLLCIIKKNCGTSNELFYKTNWFELNLQPECCVTRALNYTSLSLAVCERFQRWFPLSSNTRLLGYLQ